MRVKKEKEKEIQKELERIQAIKPPLRRLPLEERTEMLNVKIIVFSSNLFQTFFFLIFFYVYLYLYFSSPRLGLENELGRISKRIFIVTNNYWNEI